MKKRQLEEKEDESSLLKKQKSQTREEQQHDTEMELQRVIDHEIGFLHSNSFFVAGDGLKNSIKTYDFHHWKHDILYHVLSNTQTIDDLGPLTEFIRFLIDKRVRVTLSALHWALDAVKSSNGLANQYNGPHSSWSDRRHSAMLSGNSRDYAKIAYFMKKGWNEQLLSELSQTLFMMSEALYTIVFTYL